MSLRTDTIEVTGIRCERCVFRLGSALQDLDGLEAANANLMGQVTLTWDDERVRLDQIVETMARAGFRPVE